MHLACKAPGLVAGKRVHGVKNDRLDSPLCRIGQNVIKNRIDKTLGFAGTGAGRHQCGMGGPLSGGGSRPVPDGGEAESSS